jgi:hypothetical protein
VYRRDLVTADEEAELLGVLEELRFDPIVLHGQAARRTARHYGLGYDYEARTPLPGEPVPEWLEPVRERAAGLAGRGPAELVEALVQRYPEGSTIGWHRDAPAFGTVIGVSLGLGAAPLPAGEGRGAPGVGGAAGAALGLRPRRRDPPLVAALDPADEGAALLDHVPHAPRAVRPASGEGRT